MKNILCFGDSNTFGYDAKRDSRFPWEVRWTGRLQKMLGDEYRIIEEGMGGRTAVMDDPIENLMSGKKYLPSCLESHWPLDLIIIMLGTNDLKTRFGLSPADIAAGIETLVQMCKNFFREKNLSIPKILIVSPIEIRERFVENPYSIYMGGDDAVRHSREFPYYYCKAAQRQQCYFLDASEEVKAGETDWMHLEEEGHKKLAEMVYRKIMEIFADI